MKYLCVYCGGSSDDSTTACSCTPRKSAEDVKAEDVLNELRLHIDDNKTFYQLMAEWLNDFDKKLAELDRLIKNLYGDHK